MPQQPRLASSTTTPRPSPGVPPPRLRLVWRREEPQGNRFSWHDRLALRQWAAQARALGIRISLEPPDAQAEVGDFALIYDASGGWARWAVAREAGRYLLWSPSTGRTLGRFPSLDQALARIGTPDC